MPTRLSLFLIAALLGACTATGGSSRPTNLWRAAEEMNRTVQKGADRAAILAYFQRAGLDCMFDRFQRPPRWTCESPRASALEFSGIGMRADRLDVMVDAEGRFERAAVVTGRSSD